MPAGAVHSINVADAAGRRLAVPVRDEHGRVLLAAGTPLTGGLCDALLRRGFRQVPVRDGVAEDVAPRDVLTERTRQVATDTARACFQNLERGPGLPVRAVLRTIEAVIAELGAAPGAVQEFATLRSLSDQTFVHCVNVCVYSVLIGLHLGISGPELRALGTGALLHDIGKILCSDLCNRAGPYSEADQARLRQHPIDGFEMLRQHRELHLYTAHIAYQHHERVDGAGYPRGLSGDRIMPLARIVAVANGYDTLVSEFAHPRPLAPPAAMRVLLEEAGHGFDAEMVRAFAQRMAVYPTGTGVALADGSVAVVVEQGASPEHPLVRILGRGGRVSDTPEQVPAIGARAVAQVLRRWPAWLEPHMAPDPEGGTGPGHAINRPS
jgi:putative nucleotidyltransferase with HDIG domain